MLLILKSAFMLYLNSYLFLTFFPELLRKKLFTVMSSYVELQT